VTPDRTGQVWTDIDLGERVTIYVYGPPEEQLPDGPDYFLHPVIVLDQARAAMWGAGEWEIDSCMKRVL
jgi:hypothetical protein